MADRRPAPDGEPTAKAARLDQLTQRIESNQARGVNVIEIDGKSCTHEVAWPPGQEGSPLPPPKRAGPPAREYPFKIDPFQQTSINCLEAGARRESVAYRRASPCGRGD